SLSVGTVSGKPGTIAALPIRFDPSNGSVSSLQFKLTLPMGIKPDSVTPGSILTSSSKNVKTNVKGRTWAILIFGINQNAIPAGDLLMARLKIAPSASTGELNVPVSGIIYTDPKGTPVPGGTKTNGTVTVTAP